MHKVIRLPVDHVTLTANGCNICTNYLDYSSFDSIILGYMKHLTDHDQNQNKVSSSSKLRHIHLANIQFPSISCFSFDDSDECFQLILKDEKLINECYKTAKDNQLIVNRNENKKNCDNELADAKTNDRFNQLKIHFSDVVSWSEFKQLLMDDIQRAFSFMRKVPCGNDDSGTDLQVSCGMHVINYASPKPAGDDTAIISDECQQSSSNAIKKVKNVSQIKHDLEQIYIQKSNDANVTESGSDLASSPNISFENNSDLVRTQNHLLSTPCLISSSSTQRSECFSTITNDGSPEKYSQKSMTSDKTNERENEGDCSDVDRNAPEPASNKKSKIATGPGLYVPHKLFLYLLSNLLRPFAKVQSLGSGNLMISMRNHLLSLGENGGMTQLNITAELSNPGYWREVKGLWDNIDQQRIAIDYEFAFKRIISFLYWTQSNLDSVTDLGLLNVEMLMICRSSQWHETAATRKRFDACMREIFMKMTDLIAIRNWCGILREKTVFDVARVRAQRLSVLDLGTMVVKAPFRQWNLKKLFRELGNLTDFTWLNCDLRAIVELRSVEKLKRLVLHITKFDQIFYKQFFDRFGWQTNEDDYEIIQADRFYNERSGEYVDDDYDSSDSFIDDRDEEDVSIGTFQDSSSHGTTETQQTATSSKSSEAANSSGKNLLRNGQISQQWVKNRGRGTVDVQLEFGALSFAFTQYRVQNPYTPNRNANLDFFAEIYRVPKVILMANSIALNVPFACLREALDKAGSRTLKMFSVGIPHELCANFHPNRTPFPDVIRILENMAYFVNPVWKHQDVQLHVMVDVYLPDRIARLLDRVTVAFTAAEHIRIRVETARITDRPFYRCPRTRWVYAIRSQHLRVLDLTVDAVVSRLPQELWQMTCPTMEEFHLTLSGIRSPHSGSIKTNLFSLLTFLTNECINPRMHTIVFQLNAPMFFTLSENYRELMLRKGDRRLRTLGIVCKPPSQCRSVRIMNEIEKLYVASAKRLERLIMDVRLLGELDSQQIAYLQDVLEKCQLEARLAPDDCRYMDVDQCRESSSLFALDSDYCDDSDVHSESPCLDEGGDEVLLCSDYSDRVILPLDGVSQSSTQEILLTRKAKKNSFLQSLMNSNSDEDENDADKPGPSGLNQRAPPKNNESQKSVTRQTGCVNESGDIYENDLYLTPKKKRRRRRNIDTSDSDDDSWNEGSVRKRISTKSRSKNLIPLSKSVTKRRINLRSDDSNGLLRCKRILSYESETAKKPQQQNSKNRRNRNEDVGEEEEESDSHSSQSDEWTPQSRRRSPKKSSRHRKK